MYQLHVTVFACTFVKSGPLSRCSGAYQWCGVLDKPSLKGKRKKVLLLHKPHLPTLKADRAQILNNERRKHIMTNIKFDINIKNLPESGN